MVLSLSSCSKEEVEPEKDKDEVTILGTWRCYTDEAKGYYYQITLEEDGTLIWREYDSRENETSYDTYTYEDGYITWYEKDNDIEAIWYVSQLYKTKMITYRVNKHTGEIDEEEKDIWVKIK